jgi:hypothetical protein
MLPTVTRPRYTSGEEVSRGCAPPVEIGHPTKSRSSERPAIQCFGIRALETRFASVALGGSGPPYDRPEQVVGQLASPPVLFRCDVLEQVGEYGVRLPLRLDNNRASRLFLAAVAGLVMQLDYWPLQPHLQRRRGDNGQAGRLLVLLARALPPLLWIYARDCDAALDHCVALTKLALQRHVEGLVLRACAVMREVQRFIDQGITVSSTSRRSPELPRECSSMPRTMRQFVDFGTTSLVQHCKTGCHRLLQFIQEIY